MLPQKFSKARKIFPDYTNRELETKFLINCFYVCHYSWLLQCKLLRKIKNLKEKSLPTYQQKLGMLLETHNFFFALSKNISTHFAQKHGSCLVYHADWRFHPPGEVDSDICRFFSCLLKSKQIKQFIYKHSNGILSYEHNINTYSEVLHLCFFQPFNHTNVFLTKVNFQHIQSTTLVYNNHFLWNFLTFIFK